MSEQRVVAVSAAWLSDESESAERLWSFLEPFVGRIGALFARPFLVARYEELTASSVGRAIEASEMGRRTPRGWSHRVLLRWTRGPGSPDGACRFRIGMRGGVGHSMSLILRLPEGELATVGEALLDALRSGSVDESWLGPADLAIDERVGLYTFVRDSSVRHLPSGSHATAVAGGLVVRACPLSSGELEMRAAIAGVAHALSRPGPSAGPSLAASVQPRDVPVPAVAAAQPAAFDVDETALLVQAFVPRAALPFSGSTSPEHVSEMFDPVEPRTRSPEPGADETALLVQSPFVMPKTGTFRDQLGPLVIPVLSLDEYAELRARLTIYGESHEPTLKRFGVAAREVHQALRARFSEYFLRDPNAQAQFLLSMQAAILRVRDERDREGT